MEWLHLSWNSLSGSIPSSYGKRKKIVNKIIEKGHIYSFIYLFNVIVFDVQRLFDYNAGIGVELEPFVFKRS